MAGQTNEGGERRRALHAERTGSGRRAPGHAAPVPTGPAPSTAPDPFTTPVAGTRAVPPAPAAASSAAPTPPLGTPLPSRRDRAALRRPTALDEAAVRASARASDSAAWRTSPALEDPRTASAIARPSPLTHALARTLTEHLDSLTPPAGLSPAPGPQPTPAPSVYVPRRRPAPAVSGPLPVVTTTAAEPRREASWTTEPVASRRSLRPGVAGPSGAEPLGRSPFVSEPVSAAPGPFPAPHGDAELPPPPPAAEVEAAARARAARLSTAPVPPPMPDRVTAEPQGRTSFLVPDLPTTGLPTTGLPTAGRSASAPAPATATAAQTTAAQTTAAPAALRGREPGEPRHGRPTGRSARPTGRGARATGRAGASTGPVASATTASGSRTPGSSRTSGSTRPPARPGARDRRWHQRRALGLPVGLLAAAVALAAAVVVGAWAGAPGHDVLTAAMASADRAAGPSAATPAAAAPAAADPTAGAATEAGEETGEAGGSSAAAAPAASADPSSAAASPPASAPAAAAPAAPASPRTAPLGDVTYEVYGTAKDTYVELGTEDSREERQDLGSSYTKTMTGSKDWPGQYVAVSSFDGAGGGSVGCRIKDADGTVLAEEESSTPGQPATCIVGAPAGIN